MIHKLVFDTTDANTIADSANVGAWIRAADGTQITHVTEGSNERLHVDAAMRGTNGDAITVTGGALDVNIDNASIAVTATDLDIRDLTAASDSVESWTHDGTGTAITSTGTALDVNIASGTITTSDAALADGTLLASVNTLGVASTAEDIVGSALANRKYLWVYNNKNRDIFIGGTGVTEAAGFPIPPGALLPMRAGPAVAVQWNGPNTAQEIRVLELS